MLKALTFLMALAADVEYEVVGHTEIDTFQAGAADTLYKGGIMNVGTDGYLKVAADVADEYPAGVMVKNHVSDGSSHESVRVESGKIWIAHAGAEQADVSTLKYATADDTLADSATNVGPLGLCIGWKTGYLLIDTRKKALS